LYIEKSRKKFTQEKLGLTCRPARQEELTDSPRPISNSSRRVYGFVKANGAKDEELFRKALHLFEKALSSF